MAVFTFSTKNEIDTAMVAKLKADCKARGKNFSHYVVTLIKEDRKCQKNSSNTN